MIYCVFFFFLTAPWGAPDWPLCDGLSQSPIDIDQYGTTYDPEIPSLEFSAGYFDSLEGKLENNGHTGN